MRNTDVNVDIFKERGKILFVSSSLLNITLKQLSLKKKKKTHVVQLNLTFPVSLSEEKALFEMSQAKKIFQIFENTVSGVKMSQHSYS